MNSIEKLAELFREFPGIGPRQAKRFVYHLLRKDPRYLKQFAALIVNIREEVRVCASCFRLFNDSRHGDRCSTCVDDDRDPSLLLVVEKDVDLESIEKSGAYSGRYFVLGGEVAILEKEPEQAVRSKQLLRTVEKNGERLKEVILAFSVNAEGENTAEYISQVLTPLREKYGFKVSTLGRGLSTGSELEYADSETLKSALLGRA